MAARLKLTVAYDGAPFSGWQSQPNRNGVQDHLEKALGLICSQPIRVHGAGRTDAGVHALAQVAHADVPKDRYTAERWASALNGILPPTLRILRARYVPESFHARFSAKGKVYRYRIWRGDVTPPLEHGRVWQRREPLDCKAMTAAATLFAGRHDFRVFAANRGAPVADTTRTIRSVRLTNSGRLISIEFDGDGFLYKMVRMMVAALVEVGLSNLSPNGIRQRLARDSAAIWPRRMVAPAAGLFLVRVRY